MCTVLLPPGGYPMAIKYIISYIKFNLVSIFDDIYQKVTFCVETAFYNGLLKERYKGG